MTDLTQCPCTGMNLDKLVQPTILLLLAEQDLHGYALVQKMTNSPMFKGDKPDATGVYRFLKAMEDRSHVISEWDLTESGPPRKIYKITASGVACLDRWVASLQDYLESIQTLLASAAGVLGESGQAAPSEVRPVTERR